MFKSRLFSVALLVLTAFAMYFGVSQIQQTSEVHAAKQEDKFEGLENFSQVQDLIKSSYVEEIDDNKLMQGAIRGMLQELDPHSSYFSPDQYKAFITDMKGEFGGLGMTVGQQDGMLVVVAPIEDTPAYNAGVKSGDLIIMIDNASTQGMSTEEAVKLMRGKPKTSVKLTIARKGESKPLEFTIVRDNIRIKSVKSNMIGSDIGYVRFTSFQEASADEVKNALESLKKQGATSTILDLRNNPGGSLTEAVKVASLFLPSGKAVVITKNRSGKEQTLDTRTITYRDTANPLVILVNEGSASASEIVAGAVQDYGRGMIVGTTTFGKASVQTVFDLRNGGAIKLTTARYYTPKNRSIQGVGIIPDMVVPQGQIVYDELGYVRTERDLAGHLTGENEANAVANAATPAGTETDLQLQSAIQIIKGMAIFSKNGK